MTTQDKSVVGLTLTNDQWNTILNMIKSLNNKPSSNEKLICKSFYPLILDMGASCHMTRDKHLLMDLSDIFSSPIIILDEAHANVVH